MSQTVIKTAAAAGVGALPKGAATVVPLKRQGPSLGDRVGRVGRYLAENLLPPLVTLVVLLALWEVLCSGSGSALPPPSQVVTDTWELIANPFYTNGGNDVGLGWQIWASLQRVAMGYSIAVVVGIALGVLVGQSQLAMKGLDPIFQVLRTVPPLAWLPLSLAAFQDGQPSRSSSSSSPPSGRSSSTPRSACATSRRTIATSPRSCASTAWSSSPRS